METVSICGKLHTIKVVTKELDRLLPGENEVDKISKFEMRNEKDLDSRNRPSDPISWWVPMVSYWVAQSEMVIVWGNQITQIEVYQQEKDIELAQYRKKVYWTISWTVAY